MATFPAGTLLFPGYKYQRRSNVVRSEMDSGPAKQALRSSTDYIQVPVTYRFTKAEYLAFQIWVRDTINKVGWFDWTEPLSSLVKQTRIVEGDISNSYPNNPQLEEWIVEMVLEYVDV